MATLGNDPSTIDVEVQKRYPPDDRQRRLCDYSEVPTSLWSFYRWKQEPILRHYLYGPNHYVWFTTHFSKPFFSPTENPNHDQTLEAQLRRRFPDLTMGEMFFFLFTQEIEHLRRQANYFLYHPVRLEDACWTTLLRSHSLDSLKRVLPIPLFQTMVNPAPMPVYHPRDTPSKHFSFCDMFSECDRIFPKRFVRKFQNNPRVRCTEYPLSLRLVYFYYVTGKKRRRENVCSHCMKKELETSQTKSLKKRYYYKHNFGGFFRNRITKLSLNYFNRLLIYAQKPIHWCHECKQVPLFQILKQECLEQQYGKDNYPLKEEIFL